MRLINANATRVNKQWINPEQTHPKDGVARARPVEQPAGRVAVFNPPRSHPRVLGVASAPARPISRRAILSATLFFVIVRARTRRRYPATVSPSRRGTRVPSSGCVRESYWFPSRADDGGSSSTLGSHLFAKVSSDVRFTYFSHRRDFDCFKVRRDVLHGGCQGVAGSWWTVDR